MNRICALFFTCFLCFSVVYAQETESETTTDLTEPEEFVYKANQKGDWLVRFGGAADIPLTPKNLNLGLDLTLGFYTFLSDSFALGGDANFSYATTIGDNLYYSVPIMVRGMYQFTVKDFEIPISLGAGLSIQTYIERYYFGLIINPEIGFYYRFKTSWSAGLNVGVNILPQWYDDATYNKTGYIMDTGLSVRYHF